MSILSGIKKVIPYFKNADGNYEQLSYKTSSQTVDFDDGKTAETKLGAIKGITTSTSVTETGYAADAKTVSEINQSLDNKVESKNDVVGVIDGNFVRNGVFLANGLPSGWQQIVGKAIIPFNWYSDYGLLQNCEVGSFLYCINYNKNRTTLCLNVSNNILNGLNADANDNVVFFGIRIPKKP